MALAGWKKHVGDDALKEATSYVAGLFRRAEHSLKVRAGLLEQSKIAFVASAVVMGCCFIGLAATPWLGRSWPYAWTTATLAIVGGIACLVWYARIVQQALD